MSKIICDICGTSYPKTAECCPICGCAPGVATDLMTDERRAEETVELSRGKAAKKHIFDFDEVNTLEDQEDPEVEEQGEYDEEDEDEEEAPRYNVFVVILLTVLIVALLVAAGFIFVKYFLPNMGDKTETVPEPTVQQIVETTESLDSRIPCETLILNSALKAELNEVGFAHLINVMPSPKDTTDVLTFVSADPGVATVSEDGKITAVAEGETIVTISCGDIQMFVNVVCDFTPETEPPTEETVGATEAEEVTEEADSTDETTGETVEETEAEAEENEGSKEVDPSITLKLKRTDISLGAYYQFRLELDCNLDPKDVEWSSEHRYVASVNEEGVVTALMKGAVTDIIVKYGDQEVRCKVRVV